jgi:outer membrane protein assembly factor BamD
MSRLIGLLALLALVGCGGAAKKADRLSPLDAFQRAESFMSVRRYSKAIGWFEKVDTSQDRALRAQVHLRLADAYFEMGGVLNLAEAQARYQSFLNAFPLSDQAAYAQYRLARCLQLQISPPERDQAPTYRAMGAFRKVEALYPNSPWVAEADKSLAELEDHLARDSMIKARFYFRRKAYPATTSRLRELLEDNPDWPGRDEALYYLGLSLRRSGRAAEGDDYLRQVVDDFPDSKYRAKASRLLASS